MEFPDLGEHCSLPSCKQLDFLPFTCDACSKIFCDEKAFPTKQGVNSKDHLKYSEHQCVQGQAKDRRVPVCPLCNQPISVSASESVDQKVNEHIENYCKSDLAKHKRSNKCKVKGCKQNTLVPVLCASCKQSYCLRHRHEGDHDCASLKNRNSNTSGGSSAASRRAGQEASKRFATQQNTNPSRPRPPQTSTLSSIGADLNRSRNDRYRGASTFAPPAAASNARSLQNNMSEDQALALALQASLSETSFNPPSSSGGAQQASTKPLTRQEREDMELARALQESEKEERQRNRQQQQQEEKKDGCVIA